jgi:hypothetical protein
LSYVQEVEITLLIEGQPPLLVKAGESFKVPANSVGDRTRGQEAVVIAT